MAPGKDDGSIPGLFARALELEATERRSFLDDVAARDPGAAATLARLLAETDRPFPPLDRSPWGLLDDASLPETIAGFRIVRELGRGGMGRVLLAEEVTETFRRKVALKIVERPGDEESIRRFRDEVRILSSLEHPGIARFLSGGRAADGTWFLALEPVEGENLLAWSVRQGLSVRERVELFVRVLEPVAYAHRRGVVHRDLKPSHLLVDAEGKPRLLDFGISKLVDPESRRSVHSTHTQNRALTPAYASPEQFRGEPVTTASDVFSLGVVLYELLSGKRPFGDDTSTATDLERAVLESEPPPPSVAARRAAGSAASAGAAGSAGASRGVRRGAIDGDLDAVCLRALQKLPAGRYADAGELAADLARHLRDEPVEAQRGALRRRLVPFLRRHRGALATAVAAALVIGSLAVAALARREVATLRPAPEPPPAPFSFHRAERTPVAELEAAFARAPADVEAGASLALALHAQGRAPEAQIVTARLRQIPGRESDPLVDYVDASLAMSAGEPQRALVLFTRARDNALRSGRGDLVGQIRASRGRLLSTMGQREEAGSEMSQARLELERAGDDDSLARVLNDLAIEQLQTGAMEAGRRLLEQSIAAAERAGASAALQRGNLAIVSLETGRPDRAEPELRRAVAEFRKAGDLRRVGEMLEFLAEAVRDLGRPAEAEALAAESITALDAAHADGALVNSYAVTAELSWDRGDFAAVANAADELERLALRAGDRRASAFARYFRGRLAAVRGDVATSRALFGEARRLLVENGDLDQAAVQDLVQARLELVAGDVEEAARRLDESFSRLDPGAVALGSAFGAAMLRARIDVASGRFDAAETVLREAGATSATSPSLGRRIDFLRARAALAAARGEREAAFRDLDAALVGATGARRVFDSLQIREARARLDPGTAASRRALDAVAADARASGIDLIANAARRTD